MAEVLHGSEDRRDVVCGGPRRPQVAALAAQGTEARFTGWRTMLQPFGSVRHVSGIDVELGDG
jgi:hypothetical protein